MLRLIEQRPEPLEAQLPIRQLKAREHAAQEVAHIRVDLRDLLRLTTLGSELNLHRISSQAAACWAPGSQPASQRWSQAPPRL